MPQQKGLNRISITIDDSLLGRLDNYVRMQQIVDKSTSRSEQLCKLVQRYIPTE